MVCADAMALGREKLIWMTEWKWNDLRTMKVGGNDAARRYYKSHGGTAALTSQEPKVKYDSKVARSYRDELERLSKEDVKMYGFPTLATNSY
jgi:ADP-ribosylation factor GTPase-activating protein 2/3